MNVWHLIVREAIHRRGNFVSGFLSVTVAVGFLMGTLVLLRFDQLQTEVLLEQRREEVSQAGADLEDAMRKITKGLGFNVIILPDRQDLAELHLEGSLSQSMPEEYATRLAQSKIVTVNHLLPTVIKKMTWPERNIPVVLYGTRGEVPIMHADPKKPLLDAVPPGSMIAGFEIGRQLDLQPDHQVTFMNRPFSIVKVHEQRGTADDNTLWINLAQAQEMLGMQNLIHAIQALECQCAGDRISQIRQEIQGILPGTQVIERGPPALARAEARQKAKDTAEMALEQEQADRLRLRQQREQWAGWLVPLILAGSALWIAFLTLANVRQRQPEIGILRAMGYRARQILSLVLGRSVLIGALGALAGLGLSLGLGGWLLNGLDPASHTTFRDVWQTEWILLAFGLAVGLSLLASWVPAFLATRQDPAVILSAE
jgi:hypothetical protein